MNEFDREPWIDDVRGWLDDSARSLDAASLSRLNRARQAALAQRRPRLIAWLPAAALACACTLLLAVAWWQRSPQPAGNASPAPAVAAVAAGDADMLTGDDSIDFYQNLEFYAWLDAQGLDGDG